MMMTTMVVVVFSCLCCVKQSRIVYWSRLLRQFIPAVIIGFCGTMQLTCWHWLLGLWLCVTTIATKVVR